MTDLAERDATMLAELLAERNAEILKLRHDGKSRAEIRVATGANSNIVDNVIGAAKRSGALMLAPAAHPIAAYDRMVNAIAEAKAVDDVMEIADQAEAMRVYAHRAKNKDAEIDAAEIRIRAERRLGEIIVAAKDAGEVAEGRPPKVDENCAPQEQFSRVTLSEAGIDRKLSSRAQKLAGMDDDSFAWQLSGWREHALEEGARVSVRLIKGEAGRDKATARAVKEELLGRQILALPAKKYGVILEDFEWDFQVRSRLTGMDRHASNHYSTAADAHTPEEIVARTAERFECAADNCFLGMWAPVPHLAIAIRVMELRGFRYVSSGVWVKYRPGAGIGPGWWLRVDHELMLFGVKGSIPCPAQGEQRRSVFDIPASRVHSQKPDDVAEMLEAYFPTLPKIELNRRGPARPGWDAWGNEVEESQAKAEEAVRPDKAQAQGMLPRGEEGRTPDLADDAASRLADGRTSDATEVAGRDSRERPAPSLHAGTLSDAEIPEWMRRENGQSA